MEVIIDILERFGVDSIAEMSINECYRIERDGFDDLVIEKVADDRLSVAQVYTQRGDLMRDPEVVFRIDDEGWTPVMYQHDPWQYEQDDNGLPDVRHFCEGTWNTNLRKQGFVTAAEQQSQTA